MGNTGSTEVSQTFSTEETIVDNYNKDIKSRVESEIDSYNESINNIKIGGDVVDSDIDIEQLNVINITQEGSMRVQYALETDVSDDVKLDLIRTALTDVENTKLIGKTGAYSEGDLELTKENYQNICNEMAYVLNVLTESSSINNVEFNNVINSHINVSQVNKSNIKAVNKLMADYADKNNLEYSSITDEEDNIKNNIKTDGLVTEISKFFNDLINNVGDLIGSAGTSLVLLLLSPIIVIIVIVVLILLIKLIYKYLNNKIKSKEQIQQSSAQQQIQPTEQQIQK